MVWRSSLVLFLILFVAGSSFAQTSTPPELVTGNNAFAFDLYHAVENQDGNLFFAPLSISQAFAMLYLGADGKTAQQLTQVLHYTLPDDQLHIAMYSLSNDLTMRGSQAEDYYAVDSPQQGPSLSIVNSLWIEQNYPFEESYLTSLTDLYDSELHQVDFQNAVEATRQTINQWISDETLARIPEAIPVDMLSPNTKFILLNAIYFKNFWFEKFDASATQDAPFTLLDGSTVIVPMMYGRMNSFSYYAGNGYQMVRLPYEFGQFSMVIFVPENFTDFEANFSPKIVQEALDNAGNEWFVEVRMPRFRIETTLELKNTLKAMGIVDAFDPAVSDFSLIGSEPLWIDDVLHKTFIAVDEFGTEAAGVTIVEGRGGGGPPEEVSISLDRPFIFVIRDDITGTILFMGRVLEPEGGRELAPPPTPTNEPG